MGRATLSLFAAICFIGVAQGIKCSTGTGHGFPITCPGLLDSTKNHCCEMSGSFKCCDEEEFARQEGKNDDPKPPVVLRHKRRVSTWFKGAGRSSGGSGMDSTTGWSLIGGAIFLLVFCLSCRYCACRKCCDELNEDDSNRNVTIVQPVAYIPDNTQINFYGAQPNQSGMQQSFTPQPMPMPMPMPQAPPPYMQMGMTN